MRLDRMSALELGELVRRRVVSPSEVLSFFEKRIQDLNPMFNAFTLVNFEEAEHIASYNDGVVPEDSKKLFGVPTALKDFLPSKRGWTNSHGGVESLICEDTENSVFWEAARSQGCVAVGKTNAPAFAFRGTTDNKLYGPTKNPFNPLYNAGGSSGGSACAVALGMVPLAEGSDGGGSIRIPASWCNCFGFKPSAGFIPSVCRPDGWTATHPFCENGVITRSVLDSAYIFDHMKGYNPKDPYSVPYSSRLSYYQYAKDGLQEFRRLRIAYTEDFGIFKDVDVDVSRITREAASKFALALGTSVSYIDMPRFKFSSKDLADMWCKSISVDTSLDLKNWKAEGLDLVRDHRDELNEEFIYWNEEASKMGVDDFRLFNEMRTAVLDLHLDLFEQYDIILSPVTMCKPVKNSDDRNTLGPDTINPLIGYCETFLENFIGYPAASVPAGMTPDGLPIGLQVIGKRYEDEDVLMACHMYEQACPWIDRFDRISY